MQESRRTIPISTTTMPTGPEDGRISMGTQAFATRGRLCPTPWRHTHSSWHRRARRGRPQV